MAIVISALMIKSKSETEMALIVVKQFKCLGKRQMSSVMLLQHLRYIEAIHSFWLTLLVSKRYHSGVAVQEPRACPTALGPSDNDEPAAETLSELTI